MVPLASTIDSNSTASPQASREDLIRAQTKRVIHQLTSGTGDVGIRLLREAGDDGPAVLGQSRKTLQRNLKFAAYLALILTLMWAALFVLWGWTDQLPDYVFWGYTAVALAPWAGGWLFLLSADLALAKLKEIEGTTEGLALVGGGLLERAQVVQRISNLSPREFEEELGRLYEKLGYSVSLGSFVDDFGADLIATRSGERLVVQAKKTSSSIGRPTLQKLQGAALHFHGKPVLATTGKFSGPAREYAIIHGIELIDGETLIEKLVATFSKRT